MSLYKTGLSLCELPRKWHSSACILQINYFFASLSHLLTYKRFSFISSDSEVPCFKDDLCVCVHVCVYVCTCSYVCFLLSLYLLCLLPSTVPSDHFIVIILIYVCCLISIIYLHCFFMIIGRLGRMRAKLKIGY